MAFDPNIPQSTQTLLASQALLLANNQQLNASFAVNHIAFADNGSTAGFHTKLQFPAAIADMDRPVNNSPEASLFPGVGATTGLTELFFTNSAGVYTQITGNGSGSASSGYTRLPSGILIKWGQANGNSGTVTMSQGPSFSTLFNVQLTIKDSPGAPNTFVYLNALAPSGQNTFSFVGVQRLSTASTAVTFQYLAIGI